MEQIDTDSIGINQRRYQSVSSGCYGWRPRKGQCWVDRNTFNTDTQRLGARNRNWVQFGEKRAEGMSGFQSASVTGLCLCASDARCRAILERCVVGNHGPIRQRQGEAGSLLCVEWKRASWCIEPQSLCPQCRCPNACVGGLCLGLRAGLPVISIAAFQHV